MVKSALWALSEDVSSELTFTNKKIKDVFEMHLIENQPSGLNAIFGSY